MTNPVAPTMEACGVVNVERFLTGKSQTKYRNSSTYSSVIIIISSKECQTMHWKTAHKSVCIILCAQNSNNSKQLTDLDVKQLKCVIKGKCNELKIKVEGDLDSKSKEELVTLGRKF